MRLALFDASHRWGGAGYVVIPHTDGEVHPVLLEAIAAYDPDFVVELQPTVRQFEAAYPGLINISSQDGRTPGEKERGELLQAILDDGYPLAGSSMARDSIAGVCTPHRQSLLSDHLSEHVTLLTVGHGDDNLPGLPPQLDDQRTAVVACPPSWGGLLAVATAARFGSAREPQPGAEPELDDETQLRLAASLLSAASERRDALEPPDVLVEPHASGEARDSDPASSLDGSLVGLTTLMRRPRIDRTAVLVVGDEADDFALAMLWDRVYGNAIWVPSVLRPDGDGPLASSADRAILAVAQDIAMWNGKLHLASCSLPRHLLERIDQDWELQDEMDTIQGRRRRQKREAEVVIGLPDHTHDGVRLLGVREQYDRYANLPVTINENGTRQLVVPLPTVVPDEPTLAVDLPSSWQIDLEYPEQGMPRGRGIDGAALVHENDPEGDAWVRSGRDGFTIHSHRFGFIPAGASLEASIAKPRVRELGLLPWVQQMAAAASLSADLSEAGRRARIVERLWGGRTELMDAMSGPLRPMLRAFRPTSPRTDQAYPIEGHGVVLAGDGYLSYAGLAAVAPADLKVPEELRTRIDELLKLGVLTRGLILACGACQKPGFVSVDHLSQHNECPRCNEVSPLVQPRWRKPNDEPIWFYRLHWAIAELFDQNGDVPLLLAADLRRLARGHYTDVGEVEFVGADDGSPTGECDLIALTRGKLLVVEAKSNDTLDTKRARRRASAAKRVQIAAGLHADEVVLATTQERWHQGSIDDVRHAITKRTWQNGRRPRLRLVTGLGETPRHDVLDSQPD